MTQSFLMKQTLANISYFMSRQPLLLAGMILIAAAFFRVYEAGDFGLSFDQVQILEQAQNIVEKNVTLIGPRTGPASMFTGPLIYYVSAPILFFFGPFTTVYLVPLILSMLTGITLFLLTRRYVGKQEALIALTLWAFSPFIVSLDRVFWNPNLMLAATFLIFIPLLRLKVDKLTALLLFAGAFLSYQAHFSGFLLVALGILSVLAMERSWKLAMSLALGLLISLIPTIVFDLRNEYLNANGLLTLFSDKNESSLIGLGSDLFHNIYIVVETFGKLIFYANHTKTIVATGLLLLMAGLIVLRREKHFRVSMAWLALIAVAYSFYSDSKPEYYFLIAVPALLFIGVLLLVRAPKHYMLGILAFFVLNATMINLASYGANSGTTIQNVQNIRGYLSGIPVKEIIYDMPYGSDVGLKYILSDIQLNPEGKSIHVGYPNQLKRRGVTHISDLAVWSDERVGDNNFLTTDAFIIATTKEYFLFQDHYPVAKIEDFQTYHLVRSGEVVGKLEVAQQNRIKLDWVAACGKMRSSNFDWEQYSDNTYLANTEGFCFRLELFSSAPVGLVEIGMRAL